MRSTTDPHPHKKYLDTIVNESERLTRLLNNVLDFSQIERGQKNYHLRPTRLNDVIDAALKTMEHPLAEQGFDLRLNITTEFRPSRRTPTRSSRQILNLITNRSENISTPILMLTARGEETDRVAGLDLGADDYVTKPFSVRELLARVRALLRRTQSIKTLPDELRFDDVVVDFKKCEAFKAGKRLELARKEFDVLRLLAARAGEVVGRDVLLNEVWGYENYPTTRTVDNHVLSLRAKIEANPSEPRRLLTVHGVGYKLAL
jgi:DNA-binding response OmpR family regulator